MEFLILGPLEVTSEGRRVPVSGRPRALLALLLVHRNEVVSVDRLVDELWSGVPPPSAAKIVQKYVSQLRGALGSERVETRGGGYVLTVQPGEVDVDVFEKRLANGRGGSDARTIAAALELWRGPPLAEFSNDAFARHEIARLEERRLEALEARVDAELDQGMGAELVGELELLCSQHPLRERFRRQLMLALYRGGRQVEALDVYRDTRRVLADELGLEPGPELRELERAILSHDRALSGRPAAPGPNRGSRRTRRVVAGAVLAAAAVAAALSAIVLSGGRHALAVRPNSVAILDPATGRLLANPRVGTAPTAVAGGGDSVWVANRDDRTLSRLDPNTRQVTQTIGLGSDVRDIAAGSGNLWIAGGYDGVMARVDLLTGAVQEVTPIAEEQSVDSVAVASTGVWLTVGPRTVVHIDPDTGRVRARIPVVEGVTGIAADIDHVWVTGLDRGLTFILAATDRVYGSHAVTGPTAAPAVALDGQLFAVAGAGPTTVQRFGLPTFDTTAVAQGRPWRSPGAVDLALDHTGVWVAAQDGTISHLDRTTGRRLHTVRLNGTPTSIAAAHGAIWVTIGASGGAD